jgi:hypothetical protein
MSYVALVLVLMAMVSPQPEFDRAMDLFRDGYEGKVCEAFPPVSDGLPVGGFQGIFRNWFPGRDSLVIGDTPGETLFVTGTYSIPMDVYIVNDGVVMVRSADCSIKGNVTAVQQGILDCDSSQLHFLQDYIYHRNLVFAQNSSFILRNSATTFNGFPIGLALVDSAFLLWENVDNTDWTTAIVFNDAVDSLVNVSTAGEWLVDHRSRSLFRNTHTLLVWYFFGDSSVVDFTFPGDDTLFGFVFDSTLSSVAHIGYRVEIDTCSEVMWGMIPLRGSDITISDSRIRTTGLMFNADSESLSGIVNGITYSDYLLPLQDRIYHLINTYVNTWSFYPSDSSYLAATSSIFGECVGMGRSEYRIQNAFCDGSGGHIETTDQSFGVILLSSMMCDVITKVQSVLVIGYSSILLGNIWATGSSVMALINASIPGMPLACDTSIVFIDAVTSPSTAQTYALVPVEGTATVLTGPAQQNDFDRYELSYRPLGDSAWIPFDSTHHTPVCASLLGHWNTDNLTPGYYELQCDLFDTYGNNIEALKQVNLLPGAIAEDGKRARSPLISLQCKRKRLAISTSEAGDLAIYDISGRCLREFTTKTGQSISWKAQGSGVYFIRFTGSRLSATKKVVLF